VSTVKVSVKLPIRCLLLTSVSTCFGHHYAHLQERKGPVTVFGVLFWFCTVVLISCSYLYIMPTTLSRHLQKKKTVGFSLSLIRTGQFRQGSEDEGPKEEREGKTKKLEKGVLI